MSLALRDGGGALVEFRLFPRRVLRREALVHPAINLSFAFHGGFLLRAAAEGERERDGQKRREQKFSSHS